MKIVWLGNASLLIEEDKDRILFDPFVELRGGENPNYLGCYIKENDIFITHGHFDHLYNIKEITDFSKAVVNCTDVPADTLKKCGVNEKRINVIKAGDSLQKGQMKVTALKSRHVKFDKKLVFRTMVNIRVLKYFSNFLFILKNSKRFPEGNETVAYKVESNGKKVLVLGSLNLDRKEIYPTNVDLLVLPYQGKSNLVDSALKTIERIMPKKILLDHFDDAFPPVSKTVDTQSFVQTMALRYPNIEIIKPVVRKGVVI